MNVIFNFINEYGTTILYAILTTIASYVGIQIKTIYKKYIDNKTKSDVVKTCVKAIEQLYKDLHGEEKYNKAVESISEILNSRQIEISELEIKMLIESVCNDFVKEICSEE